jgi:hypothetical protein
MVGPEGRRDCFSRLSGITLHRGTAQGSPGTWTVSGLAARKQVACQDWLAAQGVGVFPEPLTCWAGFGSGLCLRILMTLSAAPAGKARRSTS